MLSNASNVQILIGKAMVLPKKMKTFGSLIHRKATDV